MKKTGLLFIVPFISYLIGTYHKFTSHIFLPFHHLIIYYGITSIFHHFTVILFYPFTICCGITSPFQKFTAILFHHYTISPLQRETISPFQNFNIVPLNNQKISRCHHKTITTFYDFLDSRLNVSND